MKAAYLTGVIAVGISLAVATPAAAADKTSIVIGGGPYLDVPQMTQAIDKNLWKKQGLTVKMIPFRSGRAAFEAMMGGQLDYALMAEFPAVIGAMRNLKFGVLAEMSQYVATRVIASDKVKQLSGKGLAGHKIGTTIGTNVHFMLEGVLNSAGVKAEIVSVSPPDIIAALARGDVDAAAMFPSFYGGAKKALGSRYQELPVASYRTRFILSGTADMIDNSPKTTRGVLAALLEGEKLSETNVEDTQKAVHKINQGRFSMGFIKESWPNYRRRMNLDEDLINLMIAEGKWIAGRGSIKGVKSTRALYRPFLREGPLKSLAPDRVTLK